jgi:hypothetical protein
VARISLRPSPSSSSSPTTWWSGAPAGGPRVQTCIYTSKYIDLSILYLYTAKLYMRYWIYNASFELVMDRSTTSLYMDDQSVLMDAGQCMSYG